MQQPQAIIPNATVYIYSYIHVLIVNIFIIKTCSNNADLGVRLQTEIISISPRHL